MLLYAGDAPRTPVGARTNRGSSITYRHYVALFRTLRNNPTRLLVKTSGRDRIILYMDPGKIDAGHDIYTVVLMSWNLYIMCFRAGVLKPAVPQNRGHQGSSVIPQDIEAI